MPVGTLPEDWQGSVVENLSMADTSHKQARSNVNTGMLTVRSTTTEHTRQRDSLHSRFAQKIQNTKELAQQLSSRIHALHKATQHTEWSLEKLKASFEALKEPYERCKQRLQLRQKLPQREKVFDSFQEALLAEEKELQAARQNLAVAISETTRMLRELKGMTQELEFDLRDKKHAETLDTLCIDKKMRDLQIPANLDKCYSRSGGTPHKQALPELSVPPSTTWGAPETEGKDQERTRQKSTIQNLDQALRTEDFARQRWAESNELMEACQKTLKRAVQTTQAEMSAKVEHTEVLRQELLKQSKATTSKTKELEKYLGLTTDKLQSLEKPLTANAQRAQIRSCRTPREDISDQVTEALHDQMHSLKGKKLQLQAQTLAMQDTYRDLQMTQRSLCEDIADKNRAIAIERDCAGLKKDAHAAHSFGFAKVGRGQRHFSDTASSMLRSADRSPMPSRLHTAR